MRARINVNAPELAVEGRKWESPAAERTATGPEVHEPLAGEGSISRYHTSMTDACPCC